MIECRPGTARLVVLKRVIECGCRGGAESNRAQSLAGVPIGDRDAENECEGDQVAQLNSSEIFWLTLVKDEYRL